MLDHIFSLVSIPDTAFIISSRGSRVGRLGVFVDEFAGLFAISLTLLDSYFVATFAVAPLEIIKQYVANQRNV